MPKTLKRILIIVLALGAVALAAFWYMKRETKKLSPEGTYVFFDGTQELSKVTYCRPL